MNVETLESAQKMQNDIKDLSKVLECNKKKRWGTWGINDDSRRMHFAFLKNYSGRDYDRVDLPNWLNDKICEVIEKELERIKIEFENLH